MELRILPLPGGPLAAGIEMVERKGLGHPDTICDALAEELSRALSRFYLDRFGVILHHNVDKALLVGGAARPAWGGGSVEEPIEIHLAGRAVTRAGDVDVPVEELATESARAWLRANLRHLDVLRHVRLHVRVRPGSMELAELFAAERDGGAPLANDTSFGAGHAPLSPLEQAVLDVEHELNAPSFRDRHPAHGEDVKVMAARDGDAVSLTVARAFVDRHLRSQDDYLLACEVAANAARAIAARAFEAPAVAVNASDEPSRGRVYLTVTGLSAESGDDGQVGRGNRVNGLITPLRPMTLEAAAGKNPVSHVGKLYNVAARRIAAQVVEQLDGVTAAELLLVSRIGAPITDPHLAAARLAVRSGVRLASVSARVEALVRAELDALPRLWQRIVHGDERLY